MEIGPLINTDVFVSATWSNSQAIRCDLIIADLLNHPSKGVWRLNAKAVIHNYTYMYIFIDMICFKSIKNILKDRRVVSLGWSIMTSLITFPENQQIRTTLNPSSPVNSSTFSRRQYYKDGAVLAHPFAVPWLIREGILPNLPTLTINSFLSMHMQRDLRSGLTLK